IIVWKVVRGDSTSCLNSPAEDGVTDLCDRRCQAVPVCRLAGHKGSIFRITWSLDGSKLVSVSDDRRSFLVPTL
ncbi:WD repeat-containing protein 6 isoform X1, partial [Tanacetum coccineum]